MIVKASLVAALLYAARLTYLIHKRPSGEETARAGFFSTAIAFFFMTCLTMLFFPFLALIGQSLSQYVTLPQYQGRVVEVKSEWVTSSKTDSDGRSYKTTSLMHNAIVEFEIMAGGKSQTVRVPNSMRSGDEPVIGDIIRVVYEPGMSSANELSFGSVALQIAGLAMAAIIGFLLLFIDRHCSGKSTKGLANLGGKVLMYGLLPGALLAFEGMMIYAMWLHFTGERVLPIWVGLLLVCFIFGLGMLFLSVAIQSFLGKNPLTKKSKRHRL